MKKTAEMAGVSSLGGASIFKPARQFNRSGFCHVERSETSLAITSSSRTEENIGD
jgi:hypothetical protein